MRNKLFRFKQFDVEQPENGLKVNTDGVLLGAMAVAHNPLRILDIGAGSGVIALMLSQRFPGAKIDAVEINREMADLAKRNFNRSPFRSRLTAFPLSFQKYFEENEAVYDLIVSNPPYFINSLKPENEQVSLAKHGSQALLDVILRQASAALSESGVFWMILPCLPARRVWQTAEQAGLFLTARIDILSFENEEPVRCIFALGAQRTELNSQTFVIYEKEKCYSEAYRALLADFLTIF
jgi:tRNA1Val (adenine37-N6)-methyltransferase